MDKAKVIPSILKLDKIPAAAQSACWRVNLMAGSINSIRGVIRELHQAGKEVFVHIEMVNGLGRDKDAVSFVAETLEADGIIATKSQLIAAAKAIHCRCVQRFFAIDTAALQTALKTIAQNAPDEIEVMPGLIPEVIYFIKSQVDKPLIAGGLISTQESAERALASGADYISTGSQALW